MLPTHINRLQGIQILRGMAASMIVLLHCIYVAYSRMTPPDEISARAGLFLGIGVDIFFVISGFIMMMINDERDDGAGRFLVNRICRIAPNYWFYTFALAVVGAMYPSMLRAVDVNVETVLKSLFFIPFIRPNGELQPLLGVGWTLNYEMFFYLLFAVLIGMSGLRRTFAMVLTFAALYALSLAADQGTAFRSFFGNTIVFTFTGGMALHLVFRKWGRPRPAFAVVALAGAAAMLGPMLGAWNPPWETRFLLWGIPSMLIVYATLGLAPSGHAVARALERLGDASYTLYLSHTFVATVVLVAWQHLGPVLPAVFIPVAFAVSVAVALVAHRVVEIPLTHAARWAFEARRRRPA